MAASVEPVLRQLEQRLYEFGGVAAEEKNSLLRALERGELASARDVLRLHEALCFLRAYPDDANLLRRVEAMLRDFARRPDLVRHRRDLADSGVAGTAIHYPFFWPTARWLARKWGADLHIDWPRYSETGRLVDRLHLLAHYAETPGLDEVDYPLSEWIGRMKGPGETDAVFLVRRVRALRMPDAVRETFFQELGVPMRLDPGRTTPARTRARHAGLPIVYQTGPLERARPKLPDSILRPPLGIRIVDRREGARLIDLARAAMTTRARDLDAFAYGDPRDVRMIDCGSGLQFALIGVIPERRLLLESVYGLLTFKNSIPIGYVLVSALFGSSEIAYNVFDTYRGGEAAYIYGRVLAVVRHLFDTDVFTIFPYQLGHENEEGLRSGAWWFYQKIGFRPEDEEVRRLMDSELRRMARDPSHRSGLRILKTLARENMYYYLGPRRPDVIGRIPLAEIGLAVTGYLARRFGSQREKGARISSREAAALLGVRSHRSWTPGENLAWARWSPLVCTLPAVKTWTKEERTALVEVIRAKGGTRESDYVRAFDRHVALRRALCLIAAGDREELPPSSRP